jgi:hypothetical protein
MELEFDVPSIAKMLKIYIIHLFNKKLKYSHDFLLHKVPKQQTNYFRSQEIIGIDT